MEQTTEGYVYGDERDIDQSQPGCQCCDEKQRKIEQLMMQLVEARTFIREEYNKFYSHHPYCHALRKRFSWLDPETPWINVLPINIRTLENRKSE